MTHFEPELANPNGRPSLVSMTVGRFGDRQPSAPPQKGRAALRGGSRGAEGPGDDQIMSAPMGCIPPDDLGRLGQDGHPLLETAAPHRPPESRDRNWK